MPNPTVDEPALQLAAVVESSEDAIIGTTLDGTITAWNPAAERIYGLPAAEAIGQPISIIIPADRLDEQRRIVERVQQGETVRDCDTVRVHSSGLRIPISLTTAPVRTPDGTITGTIRIGRDLSARDRAERAARRLAAIVESSDDAIVSKDLNGIVTSWNRAAEQMFGYSAAEMIGESIRRIVPADRQTEEDDVLAQIRAGRRVEHFETSRVRKNGTLIPISLTISPIRDASGVVVGASKIARDVSDRLSAEAERARLLAAAQTHAAMTERLNSVGAVVASQLDRSTIVQAVTDAATQGTDAQFGAFFYNVVDAQSGERYQLYTLSGAAKEAFAQFPQPRATALFSPTFRGDGVIRIADVLKDPRYGLSAPYHGMPPGHLPVRSYLAVPVKERSGEVLGGLFFGHPEPGRFTEHHEQLVVGIAAWASVALENARLYVGVQEASRLKDEFLATLSHELRTPLNAILGYARMVRSGIIMPDKIGRAVEVIERNATSLTQIVEDVLDVSRIISGKMRLNVQPVDVSEVVRNATDAVMPAADAKGIGVERDLDRHAAPVSGDPERLQQVVWNLMTNAVKFTPPGGKVQVRLTQVKSHLEISVSDTGIGITREFLPFIFDRFRQADSGSTREQGGLGLGLGIARQLVEMHGGRIHASSDGPGTGTTFRVELPLMIVHRQAPADERVHARAESIITRIAVPDLHDVRVLAVDDDPDALEMVSEILEATGAEVVIAHSAREALDVLEVVRPDVLVADIGMPHMDGFELIARVRCGTEGVRDVPAAAVTAYARSEDRAKALKSGFQIHLSKPIDPAELMAAIAALAGRTTAIEPF